MVGHYFDMDGEPITFFRWCELFEPGGRRIARDEVGEVLVSTVWIGLNHQHRPGGAPLIFETMIFGGEHNERCWRYPTREAALAGHDQALALVRDELAAKR